MKIDPRDARLFGTGAASCPSGDCDTDVPELFGLDYLNCYFDLDGQSITLAGQTGADVIFNPDQPFITPVAVSATVVDSTDPQLDQRAWFTAVAIKGCQQENIHQPSPTAATTQFWPSDVWDPRNRAGCACMICWDLYSNTANTRTLRISVFNPNPVGTTERIVVNVHGRPCGGVPADCAVRKPPYKRVPLAYGGKMVGNVPGGNGRGSTAPL
jgi:hypothetical protein